MAVLGAASLASWPSVCLPQKEAGEVLGASSQVVAEVALVDLECLQEMDPDQQEGHPLQEGLSDQLQWMGLYPLEAQQEQVQGQAGRKM